MKKQTSWSQHIEAWRTSGLTQAEYCRRHGLAAKSFSFWLRRRRAEESAPPSVDLIPVQIAPTDKALNSVAAFTLNYQGVEIQLSTEVSPRCRISCCNVWLSRYARKNLALCYTC